MRTRHRITTALAATTLIALPLTACTDGGDDPGGDFNQTEAPTADPADATPAERIEAYLEADDAAATEGWPDTSYVDKYLTSEAAERKHESIEQNVEIGGIITGERKVSDWTVVDESDTEATVEFCDDISEMTAEKDGEPIEAGNAKDEGSVGQFELVRESESEPWMIQEENYYGDDVTCDDHFES